MSWPARGSGVAGCGGDAEPASVGFARSPSRALSPLLVLSLVAGAALSGCAGGPTPLPTPPPGLVIVVNSGSSRGPVAAYERPIASFRDAIDREVHVIDLRGQARGARGKAVGDLLAAARPPLIFAVGAEALGLVRARTSGVPIVFAMVIDYKRHPKARGDSVTGVALEVAPDVQLTQLKIFAPAVRRIGVIHSRQKAALVAEAARAAKELGLTLRAVAVDGPSGVGAAWKTLAGKVDALWMLPDPGAIDAARFQLLKAATQVAKIPFIGFSDKFVEAGCLLSLSADYEAIGAQAGVLAARILDGEVRPGNHPVEAPIGTALSVNLDTAALIGLELDDTVLEVADRVIGSELSTLDDDDDDGGGGDDDDGGDLDE